MARWQNGSCKIFTSDVFSLQTTVMWLRHVETVERCWYQFEFSVATCSEWFFMELKGLKWCYPRCQAWFQHWWLRKHHVRPSHVMHAPTSGDGKPSDSSGPTPRWQGGTMEVATIFTSDVFSLKTAVMWLRHVETCWYQFEFSVATCFEWFFMELKGLKWCYPRCQAWFQHWWLRKHHVRPSHVMHAPTSGDGKPSDSSGPTPRWQGVKMEVATIFTSDVFSLKTAVMWLRHVERCWYQFEFSVATCSEWFFILYIPSQGLTWSSVLLSPKGLEWISFCASKGLTWYLERV